MEQCQYIAVGANRIRPLRRIGALSAEPCTEEPRITHHISASRITHQEPRATGNGQRTLWYNTPAKRPVDTSQRSHDALAEVISPARLAAGRHAGVGGLRWPACR